MRLCCFYTYQLREDSMSKSTLAAMTAAVAAVRTSATYRQMRRIFMRNPTRTAALLVAATLSISCTTDPPTAPDGTASSGATLVTSMAAVRCTE